MPANLRESTLTRPPIGYKRRVAWGDVDASGAWRFTAALSYVEEAETQLMREAGILEEDTPRLPRIYVDAQFKSPAHFDDEVVVHLSISRIGTSSVHYEFVIVKDNDVAVEGRLGVAFVGPSGTSEPLPKGIRSAFAASWRTRATGQVTGEADGARLRRR
jgi:acyl-CoA thioester hydrolase